MNRTERLCIIGRTVRFETENFNLRTGDFLKKHARLNHTGIVINQQSIFRSKISYVRKNTFLNFTLLIKEQFRTVAFGEWIFCNTLIGKRVIVFAYKNGSCLVICAHGK